MQYRLPLTTMAIWSWCSSDLFLWNDSVHNKIKRWHLKNTWEILSQYFMHHVSMHAGDNIILFLSSWLTYAVHYLVRTGNLRKLCLMSYSTCFCRLFVCIKWTRWYIFRKWDDRKHRTCVFGWYDPFISCTILLWCHSATRRCFKA